MPAAKALPQTLCAMLIAVSLTACTSSGDENVRGFDDLERWQATAWQRRRTAPDAPDKPSPKSPSSAQNVKQDSRTDIGAARNPFAPLLPEAATRNPALKRPALNPSASAIASQTGDAPTLHLLGTVSGGDKIYALIDSGKRVHCVAANGPLPSYPITVARIAGHAVELEWRLPDGGHRRSTLRQGE